MNVIYESLSPQTSWETKKLGEGRRTGIEKWLKGRKQRTGTMVIKLNRRKLPVEILGICAEVYSVQNTHK